MFSSSMRATLIALCLSALSVSAAPGLSLTVSGPETAEGVGALKVVATVVNTGSETLKLLNDPRGPLSSSPTNTFLISDATGATPAFAGIKVKYVPRTVIAKNSTTSFTVLAPGESAQVEHDLSKAYNFTLSGESTYHIEASNLFRYVDPVTQEAVPLYADSSVAHVAKLTGELAVARRSNLKKRISYNACSSSEKSSLVTAAADATTYATNAHTYLVANTATTTRYVTWFGTFTSARHTTVTTHYANMIANPYANNEYDCTCTEEDTYAYVFPEEHAYIYLCGAFWEAPATGTDSKAGTLTAAKALAKSNPAEAIENADSHEYFAENNPSQA
ncbi:peptidyl-Lys metalloendopeptidase [Mycena floridula]|nr:peptidyl-Lys metalloendopeptidase [Mycena floridula]